MSPRSDRDARVERLRRRAQQRSADALAAARRAIITLEHRGQPITTRAVATEAGVSESYLAKNAALRAQIAARLGKTAPRPNKDNSSTASLRTKLTVATDRLKELEAELNQLREENANLRGALLEARRAARRSTSD